MGRDVRSNPNALRALLAVLVACLLVLSTPASAHPPGLSSAELVIEPAGIKAVLTFAVQDIEALIALDSDLDAEVSQEELTQREFDVRFGALKSKTYKTTKIMV